MRFTIVWAPLACLVTLATASPQEEPATAVDPAGHWEGRILRLGVDFDVDLFRRDGAWAGDVSIPAEGAFDLPLTAIEVDGLSVAFTIDETPGDPTFRGTLVTDSTFTGTLRQAGAEFVFELRRAAETAAADAGLDAFGPWMREALEAWRVPGAAVAVVRGDAAVLLEGYGVRSLASGEPVDPDTLFAIGSTTKAFTTFLVATEIERGVLGWDDRVRDALPDFRLADEFVSERLTVRDLVTHRSGLPRHDLLWYGRSGVTAPDIVQRMRHLSLNRGLRQTFQYNNLGFVVAGEVLRAETGKDWHELVRERVFEPLGMRRSTTRAADFLADANHATGHGDRGGEIVEIPFRRVDVVGPAGSIGSSVAEMSNWIRLQLRRGAFEGTPLVEPASLAELHTPQMIVSELPEDPMIGIGAAAHGWFVDSYRGHLRVHHGGRIDGYAAFVALFPNDDLGVVCYANATPTPLPELAVRRIADLALDLEPRDWSGEALAAQETADAEDDAPPPRVEGTSPSRPIDAFAGEYLHPGYGSFIVEASGAESALTLRMDDLGGPLEHWHFDTFRVAESAGGSEDPFSGLLVRFETDETGAVSAAHVVLEPALPPLRFTAAADPRLSDPDVLAELVGTYRYREMDFVVSLRGTGLVADVAGQPTFTLVPKRDDTFSIAEAEGYSVQFRRDEAGKCTAVELRQPNGTFIAKRTE